MTVIWSEAPEILLYERKLHLFLYSLSGSSCLFCFWLRLDSLKWAVCVYSWIGVIPSSCKTQFHPVGDESRVPSNPHSQKAVLLPFASFLWACGVTWFLQIRFGSLRDVFQKHSKKPPPLDPEVGFHLTKPSPLPLCISCVRSECPTSSDSSADGIRVPLQPAVPPVPDQRRGWHSRGASYSQ